MLQQLRHLTEGMIVLALHSDTELEYEYYAIGAAFAHFRSQDVAGERVPRQV